MQAAGLKGKNDGVVFKFMDMEGFCTLSLKSFKIAAETAGLTVAWREKQPAVDFEAKTITKGQLQLWIEKFDKDKDGVLTYAEFAKACKDSSKAV